MGPILFFLGGLFGAIKCLDGAFGDFEGLRQAWKDYFSH